MQAFVSILAFHFDMCEICSFVRMLVVNVLNNMKSLGLIWLHALN